MKFREFIIIVLWLTIVTEMSFATGFGYLGYCINGVLFFKYIFETIIKESRL